MTEHHVRSEQFTGENADDQAALQRGAQRDALTDGGRVEPLGNVGTLDGPDGCACGAGPNPRHPQRCARGHVLPGNTEALVIAGAKSAAFWRAHEDARTELVEAIVSDAGHTVADAPEALRLAAEGLAQATLIRDSAFLRLAAAGGPMTADERTRRSLTVWASAADRVERYLRLVGLRRIPRRSDNPLDAVHDAVRQVNP